MGDLEAGRNPNRNALLAGLKKSFFSDIEGGDEPAASGDATRLGLLLDLPLCRWNFHILPHHRTALNVFQPQYTLMFEKVLAGPKPWLYGHIWLEGGIDNLGEDEYRLVPGSKAALTGTVMEIVAVQREADSRLSLLVQGLARGIAVRPTQTLPFARADVQILPDDEQLLACALQSRRFLSTQALASGDSTADDALRRRLTMAAATAEERHWWQYEHSNISLSVHQTLSQVDATLPSDAAQKEADAVTAGLESAPMAPAVCYSEDGAEQSASAEGRAEAAERDDDLYESCEPVLEALGRAVEASAAERVLEDAELEAADEARNLALLESQVWMELDDLLRKLNSLRGAGSQQPVPSQLLGLLPPAPASGWPRQFDDTGLGDMARQLRERYEGAIAEEGSMGAARWMHYVPCDHTIYPARRRAQRLSYAIWAVIGGQGVEMQPLLDTASTADRLRLALLRMRDVMKKIS